MKNSKARIIVTWLLVLIMLLTMGLTGCSEKVTTDPSGSGETSSEEATQETISEEVTQETGQEGDSEVASGEYMLEPTVNAYDTPEFYSTIEDYTEATGNVINQFAQAPSFDADVESGKLPPVEDRVSDEPMVMVPFTEIGTYGGRLTLASLKTNTGGVDVLTMRAQPLFIVNSDLVSIAPNVAKAWELSDDLKEITVFLREGMKWNDGMPFTADDFIFWYEAILMNEELTPSKDSKWTNGEGVVEVVKVSDYEVKFIYPYPSPTFVDAMASEMRAYYNVPFAPKHYLEQFHPDYNDQAEEQAKEAGYESWTQYFLYIYPTEMQAMNDVNLPTIDPWTLVKVDDTGNKFYDRNPYYWKVDIAGNQLPYIEGQDMLVVPTTEAINLKAVAGELDVSLQHTAVKDQPLYIENEATGDYTTYIWKDARGNVISNFMLNFSVKDPIKKELFNNILFREALSLAINREEVNTAVWKGLATTRQATVAPTVSVYEEWMGEYMTEYDVEGANSRLDEMGLEWDADQKYRLASDGSEVSINLDYIEVEGGAMTTVCEMTASYWEAIGIKVNIKQGDPTLYWDLLFGQNELDLWLWNRDANTEFGHHAMPYRSTPLMGVGSGWKTWYDTDGAEGDKPSDDYIKFMDLAKKFTEQPIGTEEYLSIGNEMLTIAVRNLWGIGVAGMTPKPVLISNKLGNTPSEKGLFDMDYRWWMVYHPEQWFFQE